MTTVNEILAPFYIKRHYKIATTPSIHTQRLYFDAVPTVDSVTGVATFPTYNDGAHPTGWSLHDIIKECDARAMTDTSLIPPFVTQDVEMWRSQLDPLPDIFMGFDGGSYADVSGGGGSVNAAAYLMYVLKAADRSQFRLMWMDTQQASPQRTVAAAPPTVDNGSLAWFMIRSVVGFVTNDNKPITFAGTINTGYNRKLARNYGRFIAP